MIHIGDSHKHILTGIFLEDTRRGVSHLYCKNLGMIVHATRHLRPMVGGSHAHLFETDDGRAYIVKLQNNPQHLRVLTNEWLAAKLFDALGIAHPPYAPIAITEEFLRTDPQAAAVRIHTVHGLEPIPSGIHFGSAHTGYGTSFAVYDFLPDTMLAKVINRDDFVGALVVDCWTANTDWRQCVFIGHPSLSTRAKPRKKAYLAQMIDNGYCFGGATWTLADAAPPGYFSPVVYDGLTSATLATWVDRIESFPRSVLCEAYESVPREWVRNDEDALALLVSRLYDRRGRIADIVSKQVAERGLLLRGVTV